MTRFLTLVLLAAAALPAQSFTVIDVMNSIQLATGTVTNSLTITATSGDGTVCKLNKIAGASIGFNTSCVSVDGKTSDNSRVLRSAGGTALLFMPFGFGDVLCLLQINPTAGVLSNIPANGVGYSCSTNIRTAGTITGQSAIVTGQVVWP